MKTDADNFEEYCVEEGIEPEEFIAQDEAEYKKLPNHLHERARNYYAPRTIRVLDVTVRQSNNPDRRSQVEWQDVTEDKSRWWTVPLDSLIDIELLEVGKKYTMKAFWNNKHVNPDKYFDKKAVYWYNVKEIREPKKSLHMTESGYYELDEEIGTYPREALKALMNGD